MPEIALQKINRDDLETLKNLGLFYEYEQARSCDWRTPDNGLFTTEKCGYDGYIDAPDRFGYLIRVKEELAGFVLINKEGFSPNVDFHMGEFFIIGKFQGHGIGRAVAHEIWSRHKGKWDITVIPSNKSAILFWRAVVGSHTPDFQEKAVNVPWDPEHPERILFNFT